MTDRHILTITIAALFSAGAAAQADGVFNDAVGSRRFTVGQNTGLLAPNASADAVFFFKNNEYFADEVEGYTLIGYQLRPTLTWGTPRLTITGGLQALQYGGSDKTAYVRPFFCGRWQANDWLSVHMGSLPGPASHQLHEAVQDTEAQLTEKPEVGVQLGIERPHLDGVVWLNWRQFISRGDTIPERFTVGIKLDFHPGQEGGAGASFRMPASLVFEHIGGQVSDFEEPMQSLANVTLSPTLVLRPDSGRFVHDVSISLNIFGFHTMAGEDVRPFTDGWAVSPEVSLRAKHLHANLAWFHGHDFFAMRGNPLYWSISDYKSDFYESNRDMLTFGASYVNKIADWARFAVDFRGYLDIPTARLDYYYGATMVLTPAINRRHNH